MILSKTSLEIIALFKLFELHCQLNNFKLLVYLFNLWTDILTMVEK
jgi:hypothetical protein